MKAFLSGCAAIALLGGFAGVADAQILVRDVPVHLIPRDEGPAIDPPRVALPDAVGEATAPVASPLPPATQEVASAQRQASDPASGLSDDERAFLAALGRHVTDAAGAYQAYVSQVAAIDSGFRDPASVQTALHTGAAYQPEQLQQGLVAYSALIALRNQAFVDGVRAQADPAFADRLADQPEAVLDVPGARDAAADVMGVLSAQGAALKTRGAAITKAAYDVQAQPWSKQPVSDPVAVLARVKAQAVQPRAADSLSEKALLHSLVATPRSPAPDVAQAPSKDVVRGLALAALAVLGRAGDREDGKVAVLLTDAYVANCLKMAKLNLNQCLAAAGPHYDHVFCAGEHAVGETASCVVSATIDAAGPAAPLPDTRVAANGYGREAAEAYGYPAPRDAEPQDQTPPPAAAPTRPAQPYTTAYASDVGSRQPYYDPRRYYRSDDASGGPPADGSVDAAASHY